MLGPMIPGHCPGQMTWHGVITPTGHSLSQRIWDACPNSTHRCRSSCPGRGCSLWQNKKMIPSGPQNLNPPWRIVISGSLGTPAMWKHHPGGQSYGEVPNQMDIPQFTRRVRASFQMPKVRCHANKMESNYLALPTPHCIERDVFLPFNTMKFGGQDYHMKHPHKTLAYAKVLQHWAENAQLPMPGEPCQLAECVRNSERLWSL